MTETEATRAARQSAENEEVPTLTVAEVIAALQALPLGAQVIAEGCDCNSPVIRADYAPRFNKVYLRIER